MMADAKTLDSAAEKLADLYQEPFGGKDKGRYRISGKVLKTLLDRRRLYESDIAALTRCLFEKGFVLIDMDSFFVVMSANGFVNYRRANEDILL